MSARKAPALPTLNSRLGRVFGEAPSGGRLSGFTRNTAAGFSAGDTAMGRPRRWALAGAAIGAVAGVLMFAPAQWLASLVYSLTHERIQLADARGTVWNGSAVALLTGGADSRDARALPGRLNWQLRPNWSGGVLTLYQSCCLKNGVDLALKPGLSTVRLDVLPRSAPPAGMGSEDADPGAVGETKAWGVWPAAWLSGLGTPWNTMELGGAMRLSSEALSLQWVKGRFSMEGRAAIELKDLRSPLSTVPRLGSYRFSLTGDPAQPGTAQLLLETVDGMLQLSANGSWGAGGVRLRGEASAKEADQGVLANLLNIIGRREGARSILSIG